MISRVELTAYLNDYLACNNFNDYAPNGLQVEGTDEIQRICTAVTASEEAIKQAIKMKADALLVHHGFFWRGEDPVLVGMKRNRIAHLLKQDINLFAYHLPLDSHMEIGNNACISHLLGVTDIKAESVEKIPNILWSGLFDNPVRAEDLVVKLEQIFQRVPLHISGNNQPIKKIAWCSGGAQDFIEKAHALGADAYLSGEISERTYYQAQEWGIHYFACGHHATERYGIQALGEHLATKFGLLHQFIDTNNPV